MKRQHQAEIEFYRDERVQEMVQHARDSESYAWQISLIDAEIFTRRRILEIGCGAGKFSFLLAQYYPSSQIIATDLVLALVAQAKRIKTFENLSFGVIDAQCLPFLDAQFDVVFGGFVLHHLPKPAVALSEIRRVLVPQGRYIGFEPNGYNPYIYLIHRFRIGKSSNERPIFPHQVLTSFTQAGFDISVDYFFPRFKSLGGNKYLATCFSIDAVKRG